MIVNSVVKPTEGEHLNSNYGEQEDKKEQKSAQTSQSRECSHDSLTDNLELLCAFEHSQDSQNTQDADHSGLLADIDLQGFNISNYERKDCTNHYEEVKAVPSILKVVLFHSDQLEDSFNGKYGHERVVDVDQHGFDHFRLVVPSHSKYQSVQQNTHDDERVKQSVIGQLNQKLPNTADVLLTLFDVNNRSSSIGQQLNLNPLTLDGAEQAIVCLLGLLCVEGVAHHSHEKVEEEKANEDDKQNEQDNVLGTMSNNRHKPDLGRVHGIPHYPNPTLSRLNGYQSYDALKGRIKV